MLTRERQLMAQYEQLVQGAACRQHTKHSGRYDLDDLVSVARLGLYDAIQTYDHQLGPKFITHAYNRVHYALSKYVRKNTGVIHVPYKRAMSSSTVSTRSWSTWDDGIAEGADHLGEMERSVILQKALGRLKDRQRAVIVGVHLEGRTLKEVAEQVGVSSFTVHSDMQEALVSLRQYLEEHGFSLEDLVSQ